MATNKRLTYVPRKYVPQKGEVLQQKSNIPQQELKADVGQLTKIDSSKNATTSNSFFSKRNLIIGGVSTILLCCAAIGACAGLGLFNRASAAVTITTVTSTTTTSVTTVTTTTTSTTTTTTTTTTITTSTTTTTTTTSSIADAPSLWSFDNNTWDTLSNFNGALVNSATYYTPGINGIGAALSLNRGSSQFVTVSSFRSFVSKSFTVELWFYCTSLTGADYGFFGQYDAQTTSRSLHYQIRNYVLQLAFFSNDLMGATTIQTNRWYHVAFVYDFSASIQQVFLNGVSDGSRSASSYQGTSGAIVIGKTEQVVGVPNYFSGYIDEVSLVMRAKNATEILDDATLVTWHSFSGGSYVDSGPLNLRATAVSITSVTGRTNQAISLSTNSSYYQMAGFVLLGVSDYSYSITLWINPTSVRGAILVHLSTTTNGQGWCVDLMGTSSSGQIITTLWNSSPQEIIGPVVPANTWTHVGTTYSLSNGLRLYVNGTLLTSTGGRSYVASGSVNILTLGNFIQGIQGSQGGSCNSQSIVPSVYYGLIDEFRVYSREITASQMMTLAS